MYVPKNLKLNRFRIVQIPSAKEIIARFGLCNPKNFSGDNDAPRAMHKLDMAAYIDNKDFVMSRQEQINTDYENNKEAL